MAKRLIVLCLACYFLVGGMVLPLGDFSLMRDIPLMYRNYQKIVTDDDAGIIDFIGDYLLHGKEILDHNAHDKQQSGANSVQFQHSGNPLLVVLYYVRFQAVNSSQPLQKQITCFKVMATTGFKNSLFRPPLA
jgi:hypothetical protein